jgi:hypothetical protein
MDYAHQWSMPLDRAISYAVKVLRESGIETFESCEGGQGHAFTEPTIRFHGGRGEGFKALACALEHDLPVAELRRFWQILDGEPQGPHWEMTFHPIDRLMDLQLRAEAAGLIS